MSRLFPTDAEKQMYGENIEVVSRDPFSAVYRVHEPQKPGQEESRITAYSVFPGIQLVMRDIHSPHCRITQQSSSAILEISHCREGRLEYETGDRFCYLTPGDLAILHRHDTPYQTHFPLHHYHGLSVICNLAETPRCLSCFLADVTVSPHALADKFCAEDAFFVARSDARIGHIFSEMYHVPEDLKRGYFKVKVLELLLFLTALDITADESPQRSCTRVQVELARDVCRYLTEHISDRVTLQQLAAKFHVSGTSIKNCFRTVYGTSVYGYIRTQKMQMAAELLRTDSATVTEIAGRFGYDNASKFASAFRTVIGASPAEYRMQCAKK